MTSSPTERVRALLVAEGGRATVTSSDGIATAAQRVWVRLGHRVGRLIGEGGIRALQDRSVSVVAARFAWLGMRIDIILGGGCYALAIGRTP